MNILRCQWGPLLHLGRMNKSRPPAQITIRTLGKVHDHDHDDQRHHERAEERIGCEGKVTGLIFDRFGDFEGFWLDTEDGRRHFRSREKEVEELMRTAWS